MMNRIKIIRRKLAMDLTDLATRVGVDVNHMALIENGYIVQSDTARRIASALGKPLDYVFPAIRPLANRLNDPAAIEELGEAGIDTEPEPRLFHFVLVNGVERAVWVSGPECQRLWRILQDPVIRFICFDTPTECVAINTAYLQAWRFNDSDAEAVDLSTFFEAPILKLWPAHRKDHISVEVDHDTRHTDDPADRPLLGLFTLLDIWEGGASIEQVEDTDGETLFFKLTETAMVSVHRSAIEPALIVGFQDEEVA